MKTPRYYIVNLDNNNYFVNSTLAVETSNIKYGINNSKLERSKIVLSHMEESHPSLRLGIKVVTL